MDEYKPYLDIFDPEGSKELGPDYEYRKNFQRSIFMKKEFRDHQFDPSYQDKTMDQVCGTTHVIARPHQRFAKNFLSDATPYSSMLFFHGTGFGKTYTAALVAENFRKYLKSRGKKVTLIANTRLQRQFIKELYGKILNKTLSKEAIDEIMEQLTADPTLKKPARKRPTKPAAAAAATIVPIPVGVEEKKGPDEEKVKMAEHLVKVKTRGEPIKDPMYDLYGAQKFSNWYVTYRTQLTRLGYNEAQIDEKIGKRFAGTVMIIDEIHSQTNATGKEKKLRKDQEKVDSEKFQTILETIFTLAQRYGPRMKLILLTATPIQDSEEELVRITNLMRVNEGLPKINTFKGPSGAFDPELVKRALNGMVSYIRGRNPVAFATPKFPDPATRISFRGLTYPLLYKPPLCDPKVSGYYATTSASDLREIPERLDPIVRCPMSMFQYGTYLEPIVGKIDHATALGHYAFATCSFPGQGSTIQEKWANGTNTMVNVSESEFIGITEKKKLKQTRLLPEFADLFDLYGNLPIISKKIATFVKIALESPGLLYCYAFHVECGARAVAMALEAAGYKRYWSTEGGSDDDPHASILLGHTYDFRTHRRCVCGKISKDHPTTECKEFIQARYMLITGGSSDARVSRELTAFNSVENKKGHRIKIIVGTDASGTGMNYLRISQVHVLDPWWNSSVMHQIVGRAFRYCGHKDVEDKSVTIYKYASAVPSNGLNPEAHHNSPTLRNHVDKIRIAGQMVDFPRTFADQAFFVETIDEKMYRREAVKASENEIALTAAKEVAVDCPLNRGINYMPKLGDTAPINCEYSPTSEDLTLLPNIDTYRFDYIEQQVRDTVMIVRDIFSHYSAISFDDVKRAIHIIIGETVDDEVLSYAMAYIVESKIQVFDMYGRPSKISMLNVESDTEENTIRNAIYIVQPHELLEGSTLTDRTEFPTDVPYGIPVKDIDRLLPESKEKLAAMAASSKKSTRRMGARSRSRVQYVPKAGLSHVVKGSYEEKLASADDMYSRTVANLMDKTKPRRRFDPGPHGNFPYMWDSLRKKCNAYSNVDREEMQRCRGSLFRLNVSAMLIYELERMQYAEQASFFEYVWSNRYNFPSSAVRKHLYYFYLFNNMAWFIDGKMYHRIAEGPILHGKTHSGQLYRKQYGDSGEFEWILESELLELVPRFERTIANIPQTDPHPFDRPYPAIAGFYSNRGAYGKGALSGVKLKMHRLDSGFGVDGSVSHTGKKSEHSPGRAAMSIDANVLLQFLALIPVIDSRTIAENDGKIPWPVFRTREDKTRAISISDVDGYWIRRVRMMDTTMEHKVAQNAAIRMLKLNRDKKGHLSTDRPPPKSTLAILLELCLRNAELFIRERLLNEVYRGSVDLSEPGQPPKYLRVMSSKIGEDIINSHIDATTSAASAVARKP